MSKRQIETVFAYPTDSGEVVYATDNNGVIWRTVRLAATGRYGEWERVPGLPDMESDDPEYRPTYLTPRFNV